MRWMAIDSSAGTSVAVLQEDASRCNVLAQREDRNPRAHAEAIGPLLRDVLADAGLTPAGIDAVAVGVGPGPFTGLRVGIAAAIAFALPAEALLVGVPSHDAIAAAALAAGAHVPLSVRRDARRHEWFVTDYAQLDAAGLPEATAPARVVPVPEGSGVEALSDAPEAAWVGRVAAVRHAAGLPMRGTEPIYVRSPDISRAVPKSVLQ